MCSALLAALLPPRCRRKRFVLPLLAGIGAVPVSLANADSERSLSGLSPTAVMRAATVSGPRAKTALVSGAAAAGPGQSRVQSFGFGSQRLDASGHRFECCLGQGNDVLRC